MTKSLSSKTSVSIDAPADKVWEALTKPELISKYLFGTKTETTWKVGSPIKFSGEYEGKSYHDKGTILAFEPNKKMGYSYCSSMGGMEDKPENYVNVTFTLHEEGKNRTRLDLLQENIHDEKSRDHSEQNWTMVLGKLKEIVEGASKMNAF